MEEDQLEESMTAEVKEIVKKYKEQWDKKNIKRTAESLVRWEECIARFEAFVKDMDELEEKFLAAGTKRPAPEEELLELMERMSYIKTKFAFEVLLSREELKEFSRRLDNIT